MQYRSVDPSRTSSFSWILQIRWNFTFRLGERVQLSGTPPALPPALHDFT